MRTTSWIALGSGVVVLGAGLTGWVLTHPPQPKPSQTMIQVTRQPAPSYPSAAPVPQPSKSPAKSSVSVTPKPVPVPSQPTRVPSPSHPVKTAQTVPAKSHPVKTPAPVPATADPSLAAATARQPVASLSAIQAALTAGDPEQLGTLHWNTADAQAIVQAWGSPQASAAVQKQYAEIFITALLAQNASVFANPTAVAGAGNAGAVNPLQIQGAPHAVSHIDQLQAGTATGSPGLGEWTVTYTVSYTTTSGQVTGGHGEVVWTLSPSQPDRWILATLGMLPGA